MQTRDTEWPHDCPGRHLHQEGTVLFTLGVTAPKAALELALPRRAEAVTAAQGVSGTVSRWWSLGSCPAFAQMPTETYLETAEPRLVPTGFRVMALAFLPSFTRQIR